MPDPLKQSLSATQTPALFNCSPYVTRWLLLRHFIHNDAIDSTANARMDWGKKMEPLILAQAAEDLALEVHPNVGNTYVRAGLIGATADATVICPDKGRGVLEVKTVFDFATWAANWNGGKTVPRHIEIQVQTQMLVGDGERSFSWGVICVWLAGELHFFERKPIEELWDAINEEARKFFDDVKEGKEGTPFGDPVEMPLLSRLFPTKIGTSIDFTIHPQAEKLAEEVRLMTHHAEERIGHEKGEKVIKAHLKALMGDAEEAKFAGGIVVRAKQQSRKGFTVQPTSFTVIEAFVPQETP